MTRTRHHTTRNDPLAVACPKCKAPAGEKCRWWGVGLALVTPHHERVEAAKVTAESCSVCDGTGMLREAVQAWDCGQQPPDCPYCEDARKGDG